ncbi:MAG: efflux RND transporter periplasmic adaptor subunit [Bacteroidetes bacterium]|nr:efflux RND transporter periplasmic adaptor subunit [Bacteroidota bacterium]
MENSSDSTQFADDLAEVKVMPLRFASFSKEILSNGKLIALQKADLKFRSNETVAVVLVQNGQHVDKGQVIARLDQFTLTNTLKQSRDLFEKARLELQDILIGQGYSIKDSSHIPAETFKIARTKSGYDKALYELEMAEYSLKISELRAPFSGVVANLFSKENNQSATSDKFCTIINNNKFEAQFSVLETELTTVRKGQSVRIVPFAYPDLTVMGEITEVNPVVDENGMIKVKALCNNQGNKLTEGMNIKIIAEDKVARQLVIPKQALVLRSEKQVVFTLSAGLAKWNYVKTGLENSTSFTITEGLKEGDTVIYEGNLNLAHDARVSIMKE